MASGPYANMQRGIWTVQWYDGVRWRRPTVVRKQPGWKPGDPMPKKPPAQAIEALAKFTAMEQVARGRRREGAVKRTVASFLAAYQAEYVSSHAPGSVRNLGLIVDRFLKWCQAAKVELLQDVTPSVCRRWLADRAADVNPFNGKSTAYNTMAKERGLLAAAWSKALKFKEVAENPWQHQEIPARAIPKPKGSWTPDEFARIQAKSKPWLRDLLTLGCHTGLRINALCNLLLTDLAWAKPGEKGFGFVVVRPELDKAGKGYRVPMTAEVHDLLSRIVAERKGDCPYVLLGMEGRQLYGGRNTGDSIARACVRAGLKKPTSANHHMRRTFGRWAVLGHLTGRPIPLYVVSRWMGHASVEMTQRYLDIRDDESQDWIAKAGPGTAEPSANKPILHS